MLGKLTGVIDEIASDNIILDVGGVGYLIYLPNNILSSLSLEDKCSFYIHTYVREDALKLFGFLHKSGLEWFLALQNVPGVGAKVALAILGSASVPELYNAVAVGNSSVMCRAAGVGQKVAARIIAELKNKLKLMSIETIEGCARENMADNSSAADAVSVLFNLSYGLDQASNAVAHAMQELPADADCAQIVRLSLKKLASS